MRQKKAKAIRRAVYGDYSPRARTYYKHKEKGFIVADERRQLYQRTKREVKGNWQ
jgi:hypothetical protein